jgi:microcystin-dependent protein
MSRVRDFFQTPPKCPVTTGDVIPVPSATIIREGYLYCNGAAISRTTYSLLYSVIGTTYGNGNGSTTFNLPDFRGVFLRGYGGNSRNFGLYQADAFQSHSHGWYVGNTGSTSHAYQVYRATCTYAGETIEDPGFTSSNIETRPKNISVKFAIRYI